VSGETRNAVSGWSVDTLREHILALIDEHDTRYEQRFGALIESQRMAKEAVATALLAQERQVAKAEEINDRRFETFTTARRATDEMTRQMMPRIEAEARGHALDEKIAEINARIDRTEGRSGGLSAGWGYLVGAIGAAAAVLSIIFFAVSR
jgi:hypothetical protein